MAEQMTRETLSEFPESVRTWPGLWRALGRVLP